ncbi:MAG: MOSC domain-containing protein [Anaerolineales bacterium]|nr:MOSC domain-containing protein [Anaerolineales bacterium]
MASVFQINISNGGVPKRAIPQAWVSFNGIEGDAHKDLRHHGGEDRAVCLYSLERILALQAEGHPIYPGSVGENLTIHDLDWDSLQEGMILCFQGGVKIMLTRPTTPCKTIAASFKDEAITRILHQEHPGWSRWYARVLQEGELQIGETCTIGP